MFPVAYRQKQSSEKDGDIQTFPCLETVFPVEGDYAGGIIARSLAGIGKVSRKTKVQLAKIASRVFPDGWINWCISVL